MYNSCIRLPRVTLPVLGLTCLLSLVSLPVPAQTPADSDHVAAIMARPVQVPPLIQFSNVANDEGGAPLAGRVDITFSLSANQRGGDPLWTETQHVDLDSAGRYSVQLGATQPQGVPTALFSSGEARWLGVQIGEQVQQPRVLLVSVPYALKAADAQTLGGLPAAAFLRVPGFESGSSNSTPASASSSAGVPPPLNGSGTANFVPLWTPDGNTLGSSLLFQNGSGSTGKIGIGNTKPGAKLDVSGAAIVRGALKLPSAGSATAATGKNSQTLNLVASAFNSTSNTASNEAFVWQAEPINNNSSNPLATLNLLFGSGTATPTETGVQFNASGSLQITKGGTRTGGHQLRTPNGCDARVSCFPQQLWPRSWVVAVVSFDSTVETMRSRRCAKSPLERP
ncbi:MAG TPA: hypothetical protein VFE61_19925 [Candidatus Sulfotelmatobacter sp.]|nr:hypothetical protein [Candidatus Sulfotelmatobacter sp.]